MGHFFKKDVCFLGKVNHIISRDLNPEAKDGMRKRIRRLWLPTEQWSQCQSQVQLFTLQKTYS